MQPPRYVLDTRLFFPSLRICLCLLRRGQVSNEPRQKHQMLIHPAAEASKAARNRHCQTLWFFRRLSKWPPQRQVPVQGRNLPAFPMPCTPSRPPTEERQRPPSFSLAGKRAAWTSTHFPVITSLFKGPIKYWLDALVLVPTQGSI